MSNDLVDESQVVWDDDNSSDSAPSSGAIDASQVVWDDEPQSNPLSGRLESMHKASTDTPEDVAKWDGLAKRAGVSYNVAKTIPDQVEKKLNQTDWDGFAADAPKTAQFLSDNPRVFEKAKGDIQALRDIETARTAGSFAHDLGIRAIQGVSLAGQSVIGTTDMALKLSNPIKAAVDLALDRESGTLSGLLSDAGISFNQANEAADALVSDASKQDSADVNAAFDDGLVSGGKELVGRPAFITEKVVQSAPQMLVAMAAVRQRASQILAEGGEAALKAAMPELAKLSAAIEGAQTAGNYAGEKAEDGDLTARESLASAGQFVTTAAIGQLSNKIGGLFGIDDVEAAVASGIKNNFSSVTDYLSKLGGTLIKEGPIEEGMQSATEQGWANFGDGQDLLQGTGRAFVEGSVVGAAQGGTLMTAKSGVDAVSNLLLKAQESADRTANDVNALDAQIDAIAKTKLAQLDKEDAVSVLNNMDGGEIGYVYVDSALFHTGVVTKDVFLKAAPSAADQIDQEMETGGLIRVPRNELMVGLSQNPEIRGDVLAHVKSDVFGDTQSELGARQSELDKELEEVANKAISMAKDKEKAADDFKEAADHIASQLDATGYGTKEGNKTRAILIASRASVIAFNKGMTPLEAVNKYMGKFRFDPKNETLPKQDGGVFNQYAGEQALYADLTALQRAKQAVDSGADPEQTRQETGWHKWEDGKWRFEIDDSASNIRFGDVTHERMKEIAGDWITQDDFLSRHSDTQEAASMRLVGSMRGAIGEDRKLSKSNAPMLDEVLDHPALFAAYPDLAAVRVVIDDSMPIGDAAYIPESDVILLSPVADNAQKKSLLLHEVQHAIQEREGFARGGSAESAYHPGERNKHIEDLFQKYKADEYSKKYTDDELYQKAERVVDSQPFREKAYLRLAGEIEARDTQARAGMSAEERKQNKPYISQGIPDDQVIVRVGGGLRSNAENINSIDNGGAQGVASTSEVTDNESIKQNNKQSRGSSDLLARLQQWSSEFDDDGRGGVGVVAQQWAEPDAYKEKRSSNPFITADEIVATEEEGKTEQNKLIQAAKENGFYIDGDSPIIYAAALHENKGGMEHDAYIVGEPNRRVVIRNTIGNFGHSSPHSPAQYLQRLKDYNATFPEHPIEFLGVNKDKDGVVRMFTAQAFIPGKELKTKAELDMLMRKAGWFELGAASTANKDRPGRYKNKNTGAIIGDVHPGNILVIGDQLFPIDVIVEKQPNKDVLFQSEKAKPFDGKEAPNKKRIAERDAEYMAAVERGDMETAQRLVDEAAAEAGYDPSTSERMNHAAPNSTDGISVNLSDVRGSDLVPEDFWTHPKRYASDNREIAAHRNVMDVMRRVERKRAGEDVDTTLTVYRAIPKNAKDTKMRNGDWVSPLRSYAEDEGLGIQGGYKIIAETVDAAHLYFNGDSIAELGFDNGKGYAYRNTKNNRKLNDAVTRDENGNIVPLSKRFNPRKEEEYFQDKDSPRGFFDPATRDITMLAKADLSTFLHEVGHLFLEIQAELAMDENATDRMKSDMDAVLQWFGVEGKNASERLAAWNAMTLEQKRPLHEKYAESFEQYLFEGKAPSAELKEAFQTFKAWLSYVYTSIKNFLSESGQNADLNDEIRSVFDRMLATEEQIAQAQQTAGMMPMYASRPEGVSDAEWEAYQQAADEYVQAATEQLSGRALRDLKWVKNAVGTKGKTMREMRREAAALRREARMEARTRFLSRPIVQAYQFLTAPVEGVKARNKRARNSEHVDTARDSLFTAIAKLGGLNKEEAVSQYGIDPKDFLRKGGVFGKPVLRVDGGLSPDAMAEALSQHNYLPLDEHGKWDILDLEDLLREEAAGNPQYSTDVDMDVLLGEPQRAFFDAENVEYMGGRLNRIDIRNMFDDIQLAEMAGIDPYTGEAVATEPQQEGNNGAFDGSNPNILRQNKKQKNKDPNAPRTLESMGVLSDDGILPELVAGYFGMETEQLIRGLLGTPELGDIKQAIENMTDQIMLERHADLATPEAMAEATLKAVMNKARAKFVATEYAILAKAAGGARATEKQAKEYAQRVIGETKVKDVKPEKFIAAAAKAGKEAQKAMAKSDTKAALLAKRNQVLNEATAKLAVDVKEEIGKFDDLAAKIIKATNEKNAKRGRDPDVVNAITAIMGFYGFFPSRQKNAMEYLERVREHDPDMFLRLQDAVNRAAVNQKDFNDLTINEMRGLREEIDGLWYTAKRSRQMEIDGKKIDLQEAADGLVTRLLEVGLPDEKLGAKNAPTEKDLLMHKLKTAGAWLTRVEQWAERMDGRWGGAFTRYIFQPVKKAADRYRTEATEYNRRYVALIDALPKMKRGLIAAPELGYTFGAGDQKVGMAELLHAVLHTGNASNKRKLLLGRGWAVLREDGSLDTARWDMFVERMHKQGVLKKEHYDFAQGVWDLLEDTKAGAQKTHRDVFGYYFAEVTADAFGTPFGIYRGGYVPAQADPRLVVDAAQRAMAEEENNTLVNAFPATAKGFTKGRTEYNKPLMLDLQSLAQHINKVLLFTHMEPAVRDVKKLLMRNEVAETLGAVDRAAYDSMLTPWLNTAARQSVNTPVTGDAGISNAVNVVRNNTGMALMAANLSNAMQQITGFLTATQKVSGKHILRETASFLARPREYANEVRAASEYMAVRMDAEIRAINSQINELLIAPTAYQKTKAFAARHAYFLQAMMDNTMSPIIWRAAFNQSVEKGMTDADAEQYANATIRQTQGSSLPEDVSRVEVGGAFWRATMQFYGYFNSMVNTNVVAVKNAKTKSEAMGHIIYGAILPAIVAQSIAVAMRGGVDDDDYDGWLDDWITEVAGTGLFRYATAMVPVVGAFVNLAVGYTTKTPVDDRMQTSATTSMIGSALRSVDSVPDAITGNGKPSKAIKDVAAGISLFTGLPVFALARPVGYAADVAAGEVVPTSAGDMTRGLLTGTASPDSK